MQMYDRDDPADNWKTAKRGDPTEQDISLQWREEGNAEDGEERRRESTVTIVDKHGRWALCPILLTVIKSTSQTALRPENMPRRIQLENIFLSRRPHKSANYVRSITRSLELFFFQLENFVLLLAFLPRTADVIRDFPWARVKRRS